MIPNNNKDLILGQNEVDVQYCTQKKNTFYLSLLIYQQALRDNMQLHQSKK